MNFDHPKFHFVETSVKYYGTGELAFLDVETLMVGDPELKYMLYDHDFMLNQPEYEEVQVANIFLSSVVNENKKRRAKGFAQAPTSAQLRARKRYGMFIGETDKQRERREKEFKEREKGFKEREKGLKEREKSFKEREKGFKEREKGFKEIKGKELKELETKDLKEFSNTKKESKESKESTKKRKLDVFLKDGMV
jgi:hypothetical protein